MTTCRSWKLKAIKKAAKSYFFEDGSNRRNGFRGGSVMRTIA